MSSSRTAAAFTSSALEHSDGTVTIKNRKYEKEELNPRKSVSQGVALLPGDRAGASGVLLATLTDNVGIPVLGNYFSGGLLRRNKGNIADVDRFRHALLNMDQNLLDVNGVRIVDIELQPDKTR
ncbi:MAG: hypothetical protein O2943_07020 [Actinomycetota bacterium]|nr:hypothetical protein [Actinomycetota bacterium]